MSFMKYDTHERLVSFGKGNLIPSAFITSELHSVISICIYISPFFLSIFISPCLYLKPKQKTFHVYEFSAFTVI